MFNEYNTCIRGCYLYSTKEDAALESCPSCNTPRSETKVWPVLDLASKFAELIASDDCREKLLYRHQNYPKEVVLQNSDSPKKVYNDIFDGEAYAELIRKREVDHPLDIYFNLNIDGFTSKTSSTRLTIIHVVVLNYHPIAYISLSSSIQQRFAKENTFELAVIHSERKPDIYSYLKPIIAQMLLLQKTPLRVVVNGKLLAKCNIICFKVLGDGPQVTEFLCHKGHGSKYGCRICLTLGVKRTDGVNKAGIYFVHRNQEIRSYESLIRNKTPSL